MKASRRPCVGVALAEDVHGLLVALAELDRRIGRTARGELSQADTGGSFPAGLQCKSSSSNLSDSIIIAILLYRFG